MPILLIVICFLLLAILNYNSLNNTSVFTLIFFALPYVYVNPKKKVVPIRYFMKKTLGYVPLYLNKTNIKILRDSVISKTYYTKDNKIWSLKSGQSYSEKVEINKVLAEAGFYNEDIMTVFTGTRFDKYFFGNVSQNNDLVKIAEILGRIEGDKTIGIVYRSPTMLVYPFWKLPQTNQVKMNTFIILKR